MKRRRNDALAHCQHGFDKACHTGGCIEMADVRLHRSHAAGLHRVRVFTPRCCQCFELDRIAECCRRAVCFDVANGSWRHTRLGIRVADGASLTGHTWCGEADLVGAVVVGTDTAHHGVDRVAVLNGAIERLEQHGGNAVAEYGSRCADIERPAVAVGRHDAAFFVVVAAILWEGERGRTCDGHFAAAFAQ